MYLIRSETETFWSVLVATTCRCKACASLSPKVFRKAADMNLCPGLLGDAVSGTAKVFLGSQPSLTVEKRLLKHMQVVYPWYSSRKRSKEQVNDFLELELPSLDPEVFMRYSHVFFSRRQAYFDTLDKLSSVLDKGKLPKEAQPSVLACLEECAATFAQRKNFEIKRLEHAKKHSRELEPKANIDNWDYPCLMRLIEEEDGVIVDAEGRAQAFLPLQQSMDAAAALARAIVPADQLRPNISLDKKETKLISKFLLPSYQRFGTVDKIRPIDFTTYHRAFGERVIKPAQGATPGGAQVFTSYLWGHIFRKFAQHPEYILQSSQYWTKSAKISGTTQAAQMPAEVALAVSRQQQSLPAHRFMFQMQYCNAENAKQQWRSEPFVPLHRLHPLIGHAVAEDLMASVLVENLWHGFDLSPTSSPFDDSVVKAIQEFVKEISSAREGNTDLVLSQVKDAMKIAVPPTLTEAETGLLTELTAEADAPEPVEDEYEIVEYIVEEGYPETGDIPNEELLRRE